MRSTPIPELLAPAGTPEALVAAVAAGADAVYFGGRRYGARRFATNFTDEELREAVEYCHIRGVKVYITVNTLLLDDELPDAIGFILWLYEIGVDAVLVQDTGLTSLVHRTVPDLPLHASTQMTVHNREGVIWARESGFKRVVLARELPIDEIEDIGRFFGGKTAGLEIFVHGALCYCYSGQCLFSSIVGGRSGNRGACAQPCRKRYALLQADRDMYGRPIAMVQVPVLEPYLLSPRDLAVYPHLDRIVTLPIVSLKIEGRMKSPEYVATVVAIYRQALDALREGSWSPSSAMITNLLLAFNRGFTGGYLLGEKGRSVMGLERPDNRGIYLGKVISYDPVNEEVSIHLNGKIKPEANDGIVFQSRYPDEEIGGVIRPPYILNRGVLRLHVPKPVQVNTEVFLTRRLSLMREARRIMSRRSGTSRPIPVDLHMYWDDGTPVVRGSLPGPRGKFTTELRGDFHMETARAHPLKVEEIERLFRRTGDAPFTISNLDIAYPGGLFAPISKINTFRRAFFKHTGKKLVNEYMPSLEDVSSAKKRYYSIISELERLPKPDSEGVPSVPSVSVYVDTLEGVFGAVQGGCRKVFFEPLFSPFGRAGAEAEAEAEKSTDEIGNIYRSLLEEAAVLCNRKGVNLVWKWPCITRRKFLDMAVPILEPAMEMGVKGIMVDGVGAAGAVRAVTPDLPLLGSVGMNVFNSETINYLEQTFSVLTLSQELSRQQLYELVRRIRTSKSRPLLELIVQGPAELMVSEDCLIQTVMDKSLLPGMAWWGIRDNRGHIFPIVIDSESRTHVFNSVETCLLDYMPEICELGVDAIAIDARNRTGEYAREVTEFYCEAIDIVKNHPRNLTKRLKNLKIEVKKRSMGGITTGHYLRGLRNE
jgi:putative protease